MIFVALEKAELFKTPFIVKSKGVISEIGSAEVRRKIARQRSRKPPQ
jgi:hypothetical protein